MMSKTAVCVDCGQSDLRERMIRAPRGFVHTFTRNCQNTWQSNVEAAHNERDAAIARAEAAENDSRAWEALAGRAEAIVMVQQDKIAELEARLKDQIAAHQHTMNGLTEYARQNYAQSLRITELQAQLAAQEWRQENDGHYKDTG